jgi:hypothetical protein
VGRRWLDQTSFVASVAGEETGNCLQACLASLLKFRLEDVPNFAAIEGEESQWFLAMDRWLGERGLGVWVYYLEGQPQWYGSPGTLALLSGKSPRGDFQHTVVVTLRAEGGWEIVHDPHPSRDGIEGDATEIWLLHMLDPARAIA